MIDKLLKNMTTVVFFSALIAMALLFASKSTKLQSRISVLIGQNSVLEERNKELKAQADALRRSVDSITIRVGEILAKDSSLSRKNIELENEIKKNKKRYETIRPRVDGFNADSLRRYFSTID